jgi:hypothetical protein
LLKELENLMFAKNLTNYPFTCAKCIFDERGLNSVNDI